MNTLDADRVVSAPAARGLFFERFPETPLGISSGGIIATLSPILVIQERTNIDIVGGQERRSAVCDLSESLLHNSIRN